MATCSCGCGERTGGGLFRPGHDQKLRTDLERRAGGLLNLSRLVAAAERFAEGQSQLDTLGEAVRRLLGRS
jgi:hypothetical protein